VVAGLRGEVATGGWGRSQESPTMSPGVPMSAIALEMSASGAEKTAETGCTGRSQTLS